jgi:hypothetical protein
MQTSCESRLSIQGPKDYGVESYLQTRKKQDVPLEEDGIEEVGGSCHA